MKLKNFIWLLMCPLLCSCVIFPSDVAMKQNGSSSFVLSDIVTTLLKSCSSKIRKIVVNGDMNADLLKSMHDSGKAGFILLKNQSRLESGNNKNKLDAFIIATDDWNDKFGQILDTFKRSSFWSVMTHFFVLSGSQNGCNYAEEILQTLWKLNILNCYFVCFDGEQKPLVFTFNPYSNYATNQWMIFRETTNGSTYMAIYSRPYYKENICKGFYFDRTKHLDKASINIGLCIPPYRSDLPLNFTKENRSSVYAHFEPQMLDALQMSFKVSSLNFDFELGILDGSTEPYGVFNLLESKKSDLLLCLFTYDYLFGYPGSHQVVYSKYSIFSLSRGFRTPLEKMYNFYGSLMIVATILISAATYLVLWLVNRNRWFAAFEILRLWTSSSLNTKIDTVALRSFFGVIFIYFLVLQATFSGNLSKFLTQPELRHNAETIKDLRHSFYRKIYVTRSSNSLIANDELLKSKSELVPVFEGINAILRKEPSACISIHTVFSMWFNRKNLSNDDLKDYYLSHKSLRNHFFIYPIRHDWPLKDKFNSFLTWLEDTGILLKLNNDYISNLNFILSGRQLDPEFQPIELESLLFIFYFLIIGLISATVCFGVEKCLVAKINVSKVSSEVDQRDC